MVDRLRRDSGLHRRVVLAAVMLLAAVVRLVALLAWGQHTEPAGDEAFYWRQAGYLGDGYGFVFRNNAGELVTTAVHPPLYSALLGLLGITGAESHVPYRLLTAGLGVATTAVITLVAWRLAGAGAALASGILAAVQPNLWFNEVKLTAESVFALCIALVLLAAYGYVAAPGRRQAVVLCAAIGVAALARAEALALYPLLVVPLVVQAEGVGKRTKVRHLGWGLLALGLVCAPWVLRNLVAFERPALLSTGAGFVIEISNCDQTFGIAAPVGDDGAPQAGMDADTFLGYWARDCDRSDATVHGAAARPWPAGDETAAEAEKRAIGLTYVQNHLDRLPAVLAARVGRIWDLWRPSQSVDFNVFFERRDATTRIGDLTLRWQEVALWLHLVTLPTALVGAAVLVRRGVTIAPFVALALAATLTAAVSFGITRYRVGADVGLVILAGVTIGAIWDRLRPPAGAGPIDPAP